ncbi:heparan-alpha-glucosaminide N-acetyltransferase [Salinarimonas soli]|nr:heparan-alpha-glucosaminide N-acetyltransferase [Salinarimonas soli]
MGPGERFEAVDAARGAAIAAMIVFHASWDLSFLRLIATPVGSDPAWQAFAMSIAGSFLALVGVSLVLGHGSAVRWRRFGRRLGILALAAAGVTGATYLAFPDSFVFFGILHMIAVGSVLALPFLRAPLVLVAGAAALILAAPAGFRSPLFDERALAWIGFSERIPPSNDFEPVFPWLALVLIGVLLARLVLASPVRERLAGWRARGPLSRFLVRAGRWSLVIYLLHQPILLGVLFPLAHVLGPSPAAEAAAFLRSCEASCRGGGRMVETCARACGCVLDRATAQDLRGPLLRDELMPEQLLAVQETAQACFREAGSR